MAEAGSHWLQQKPASAVKSIKGFYTLKIILSPPDKRRRDLGNSEKVVSDFLQHMGIIEDDCLCQDLHILWGSHHHAPLGARVVLAVM